MAKVLVLLAEGFEEIEAVTVIDILRRAEVDVCVAGLEDMPVKGAQGIVIHPDATLDSLDESDYDMVVLPGGSAGAKNISDSQGADSVLRSFARDGRFLAAICAAPSVLAEKGLLDGCLATSYPSFKDSVSKDSDYQDAIVVVDENIVTSRGPATAAEFAFTLVELLVEEDTAEKLREAMLYNYMYEGDTEEGS